LRANASKINGDAAFCLHTCYCWLLEMLRS
jgi:hypothetical protein